MNKKNLIYVVALVGVLTLTSVSVASASEKFNRAEFSRNKENVKQDCECGNFAKQKFAGFRGRDLEIKAEVLGLSLEELELQIENGKTFREIVDEMGLSREDVMTQTKEIMQAKMQERLAQSVADGDLTQEEADERLENMMKFERRRGLKMENINLNKA